MGIAQDYRRKQRGSFVPALVAIGIGTLCVGGVAVGLMVSQGRIVVPGELRTKESLVREATFHELGRRGMKPSSSETNVEAYGADTYVVSGTYVKDDSLAVYASTCRLVDDEWRVVKLQLPTEQITRMLEEVGQ